MNNLTSEVARPGHPDKLADQLSDAVVDACLEQDPRSRVAVETLIKGNLVVLAGEVTTRASLEFPTIVRNVLGERDWEIVERISLQDPQIASGVDCGGAGDMGLMFGFATREIMPVQLCRDVVNELEGIPGLLFDGKVQLTGHYGPAVVCVQHEAGFNLDIVRCLPSLDNRVLHLRGFIDGGADWDCGVTGRKNAADNYGGACPTGGGAFSGKDPTKVDRSAAYAARFVARRLLETLGADTVQVQVAYILGQAEPAALRVLVDGKECQIIDRFDWRPESIIERFNLRLPIYQDLARNGHFFRAELPWEQS